MPRDFLKGAKDSYDVVVIGSGLAIAFIAPPDGIKPESWRLLAIFVATIIGTILRPLSGSAMVLLGITALALTKSMPLSDAAIKALSRVPSMWHGKA